MIRALRFASLICCVCCSSIASAAGLDALFAMQMPDAKGRTVAFSQYRGKPLILHFWAPWCAPCQADRLDLSAVQSAYAARGLQVLSIAVTHDLDSLGDAAKACQPGVPLVYDKKKAIWLMQSLGHVSAELPFTLLLDGQGGIRLRQSGKLLPAEVDAAMKALPR